MTSAAMAEAFFSLYCLVKNTLPQKVFFKFFKDLDMFFIYPKTAPNALWRCVYILQVSCFSLHLDGPQEESVGEYRSGTELLTKYTVKSMNLSN